MRELLALAVQHQGMNPRPAASVEDAEREIAVGDVDMMLLDLNLGGGHTGVSLALEWRERGCLLPFVIITGTPQHPSLSELEGMEEYCGLLSKPFPMPDLLNQLSAMAQN